MAEVSNKIIKNFPSVNTKIQDNFVEIKVSEWDALNCLGALGWEPFATVPITHTSLVGASIFFRKVAE